MKRFLIIAVLIMMLAVPAFAQWGGAIAGDTILHRDGITYGDFWYQNDGEKRATIDALELAGYNSVRADYDLTGTGTVVVVPMCSNDSLWVSSDSVTVTADTYATYVLPGCKDYNWYVGSVSGSGVSIDIFLTPYNY